MSHETHDAAADTTALEKLAAMPCETIGLEDMEVGCCRTCRARADLAKMRAAPLPTDLDARGGEHGELVKRLRNDKWGRDPYWNQKQRDDAADAIEALVKGRDEARADRDPLVTNAALAAGRQFEAESARDAALAEGDECRRDFSALQQAIVGDSGLSAILTAENIRAERDALRECAEDAELARDAALADARRLTDAAWQVERERDDARRDWKCAQDKADAALAEVRRLREAYGIVATKCAEHRALLKEAGEAMEPVRAACASQSDIWDILNAAHMESIAAVADKIKSAIGKDEGDANDA